MSLSSPSPSWFAKTPYCSVRDWTRFLRHRIKKYPDSPVHTLTDSFRIYFFPLWRAYLFFYGFAVEFAAYVWTVAVSATKKLRIRKYPYTCGRGLRLFLADSILFFSFFFFIFCFFEAIVRWNSIFDWLSTPGKLWSKYSFLRVWVSDVLCSCNRALFYISRWRWLEIIRNQV